MGGFASPFAFPLGGSPGLSYAQPRDHEAIGLARLLEQFKPKARIRALAAANLSAFSALEVGIFDLLTKRLLTGEGEQLDNLGRIFRVEREGRTDAAYLRHLRSWILAYRSHGAVPEIYRILDVLSPGAAVFYEQLLLDPAGFRLRWTAPAIPRTPATADDLTAQGAEKIIREARGGGVKVWFHWWPREFSGLLRLGAVGAAPSSLTGLGNEAMTTGGHMAGEVVA